MTTGNPGPTSGPVRSEFADDAEMTELVQMFVDELPERISQLNEAWNSADCQRLEHIAHQLKGASAGYGFSVVGEAAAQLEESVRQAEDNLSAATRQFDELVDLCRRATM